MPHVQEYIVRLTEEERQICQDVVKVLKGSSEKVRRAQILLKADADGPDWTDTPIAEAFHCRVQTVENLRKRLVTEGFEAALNRKVRESPPTPPKLDWAVEVAGLLDTRYADCELVTLVCDNLNTHTMGAFYEAFEPKLARQYVRRIQFCYTPKHGSWLNVAECELSCLTSQCLRGRHIGDLEVLQTEIGTWSEKTTTKQRGVDWQFKIDDARRKLKRLYPKIKT